MSRAFIKLYSGKRFYYDDVGSNEVDIRDIAAGLCHACRYNGQMSPDIEYFVAEHSVHVSNKIEEELRRQNERLLIESDEIDYPCFGDRVGPMSSTPIYQKYTEEEIRIISLVGLLHDSSEAVMGDMVSPLKKMDEFYKAKEKEVEEFFSRRFRIPFPFPRIVKAVDMKMFACEYPQIFPNDADNVRPFDIITIPHDGEWDDVLADPQPYPELKLHLYNPRQAYDFFLNRFKELGGK